MGTKFQNGLKLEKRGSLSYADLHSQVVNDVNIMRQASSTGFHQKQRDEEQEVVKYMSKLPSYLEREREEKHRQDKALNIGVLDWRSLENWQRSRPSPPPPPMPYKSSRYSSSSSNASSADYSSRQHHSSSPPVIGRRKARRPTLQSYLNLSPIEGHFECVGNGSTVPSDPLNGQKNILREYQFFNKKTSEFKKKDNWKVQDPCNDIIIHHDLPDEHKNVVLLLPRDDPAINNHSAKISHPFDLTETNGRISIKSSRMSSSDVFLFEEAYSSKLCSSVTHSCPLHHEMEEVFISEFCPAIPRSCPLPHNIDEESQMEQQHISIGARSVNFPCEPSQPSSSDIPARSMILEENSTSMSNNSSAAIYLKGPDMKLGTRVATKVRDPSPTQRFSIGLGRNSNSKDSAAVQQINSKDVAAKSGADRVEASACSKNSTSDKSNAASRGRMSSPLKRLLDPLLKPKAANSRFEQSQKDSTLTDEAADGRHVESFSGHSAKVKLDLTSLRTSKSDDNEKQGYSTLQAYLQIAVKNDLPLFTFAVDKSNDVLAATMRKLGSSSKDDSTWIYTFFTIHEVKKRNGGWLNQGSKGKDYVPNVVAQMKVSDIPFSNSGGYHHVDRLRTREFVLFAVDLRLFNQPTSDLQTNDELAAIVVKYPKKKDGKRSYNLGEESYDAKCSSSSRNIQENNRLSVESKVLLSTTVILPGGVHGLPSKGEPSSLIERWKSGGHCDCGGWDLGCRVRVLASKTQNSNMASVSTEAPKSTGLLKLFSESQEEITKKYAIFHHVCSEEWNLLS